MVWHGKLNASPGKFGPGSVADPEYAGAQYAGTNASYVATSRREAWMPGTRLGLESPALSSRKFGPGTVAGAE